MSHSYARLPTADNDTFIGDQRQLHKVKETLNVFGLRIKFYIKATAQGSGPSPRYP